MILHGGRELKYPALMGWVYRPIRNGKTFFWYQSGKQLHERNKKNPLAMKTLLPGHLLHFFVISLLKAEKNILSFS
jgi:hypothetical protein